MLRRGRARFMSGEWLFCSTDEWERWFGYGSAVREWYLAQFERLKRWRA